MKKLKTLKDLEIKTLSSDPIEQTLIIAMQAEYYTKLQMFAREWIKAIDNYRWDRSDKYLEEHPKLKEAIEPDYYHCGVIMEWIRYFFNLEEK